MGMVFWHRVPQSWLGASNVGVLNVGGDHCSVKDPLRSHLGVLIGGVNHGRREYG